MAAKDDSFMIRCQTKDGRIVISDLNSTSTLRELIDRITEKVNVVKTSLKIFEGYPPKLIDIHHDDVKLGEVPLPKNCTLRIDYSSQEPTDIPPAKVQKTENNSASTNEPRINLVRVVCPSDNSCLFNSIYFLTNKETPTSLQEDKIGSNPIGSAKMRKIIDEIVNSNPLKYNEAILGMPNSKYSSHILKPETWGGGIEISIFTEFFGIEICIFDIQTGRVDRFGEDQNYNERILLFYDGLHYDPIVEKNQVSKKIKKIFLTSDSQVMAAAMKLSSYFQKAHSYTDLQSFTIMCKDCGTPLSGQLEATQHAKLTGHGEFYEIKQ